MASAQPDVPDVEQDIAEYSPQKHWGRTKHMVGKGAFKRVWKAIDFHTGRTVAWNEVSISGYDKKELARLVNEVTLLKTLKNKHLIRFYGIWDVPDKQKLVFITEFMESGTIKQFRQKYPVSRGKIREWCRGILECLLYLHTEVPESEGVPYRAPIIHRDLKCDNIFVSSASKSVKVGDLGLATTDGRSAMGTPEFMAPDVFDGNYTTSVDIHSFGMCVLEMVTGTSPYGECDSFAQVSNKVLSGQMPDSLKALEVAWPEAHQFVCRCLKGDSAAPGAVLSRPSAAELLKDPLLSETATDNGVDTEEMLQAVADKGIQIPVTGGGFLQLSKAPSQAAKAALGDSFPQDPSAPPAAPAASTNGATGKKSPKAPADDPAGAAGTATAAAGTGTAQDSSSSQPAASATPADMQRAGSTASSASDASGGVVLGRQLSIEGTPGPLASAQSAAPAAAEQSSTASEGKPSDAAETAQSIPSTIAEEEHDSDGEDLAGVHTDLDGHSGSTAGLPQDATSKPSSAVSAPATAGGEKSAAPDDSGFSAAKTSPVSAASAPATPAEVRSQRSQPVKAPNTAPKTPYGQSSPMHPSSGATTPFVAGGQMGSILSPMRSTSGGVQDADTGGTGDRPTGLAYGSPGAKGGAPSPPLATAAGPLSPGSSAAAAGGRQSVSSMPRVVSRTTVEFHQEVDSTPVLSPPTASAGSAAGQLGGAPPSPGKGAFPPGPSSSTAAGAGGTAMTPAAAASTALQQSAAMGGTGTHVDGGAGKSARGSTGPAAATGGTAAGHGSNLRRQSSQPGAKGANTAAAALSRLQSDVLDLRRDMDTVLDSVTELNSMMRFLISSQPHGREALAELDITKQQRQQHRAAAQRLGSATAQQGGLSARQPASAAATAAGAASESDPNGRRVRASSIGSTSSNLSLPAVEGAPGRVPPSAPPALRASSSGTMREGAPGSGLVPRSSGGSTTPSPPPERVLLSEDGPSGASKLVASSIQKISRSIPEQERAAGSRLAVKLSLPPDQLLVGTPNMNADGAQRFVERRSILLDRFKSDVAEEFSKVRKKLESLDNTLTEGLQQTQTDIDAENNKHRKEKQRMTESRQTLDAETAEQESSDAGAALEGETKKSRVRAQNTRKANMDRKQKLQVEREESEQQRHTERLDALEKERARRQRVAVEKRRTLVEGRNVQVSRLVETLQLHALGLVRESTGMVNPAEQAEAMARAAASSSAAPPPLAPATGAAPPHLLPSGLAAGGTAVPQGLQPDPMAPMARVVSGGSATGDAPFSAPAMSSASPADPGMGMGQQRPMNGAVKNFTGIAPQASRPATANGNGNGLRRTSTHPSEGPATLNGHSTTGL